MPELQAQVEYQDELGRAEGHQCQFKRVYIVIRVQVRTPAVLVMTAYLNG